MPVTFEIIHGMPVVIYRNLVCQMDNYKDICQPEKRFLEALVRTVETVQ